MSWPEAETAALEGGQKKAFDMSECFHVHFNRFYIQSGGLRPMPKGLTILVPMVPRQPAMRVVGLGLSVIEPKGCFP